MCVCVNGSLESVNSLNLLRRLEMEICKYSQQKDVHLVQTENRCDVLCISVVHAAPLWGSTSSSHRAVFNVLVKPKNEP